LLEKALPRTVSSAPPVGGVALPLALATPSPAAALARAMAVSANAGSGELKSQPRVIVNQGTTECCVSCAVAGAMESLDDTGTVLSRMFHYKSTRQKPGGADKDGRLFLDMGLSTLMTDGICSEAKHESIFNASGLATLISQDAIDDARTRQVIDNPFDDLIPIEPVGGTSRSATIRQHIRAQLPVVIAFTLPTGYPDPTKFLNTSDEWLDERSPALSASRHCVVIVAFDDSRGGTGAVRVVDSQGRDAFDRGTWWMGYSVLDSALVHQAFVLRKPQ
jgi:hypothetical protein